MKSAFIVCALATSALAGPPVLVRITPEALARLQQQSPMTRRQKPAPADTTVTSPANPSIIKDSAILHDGKNWTIVPKGAVVLLPDALKSRVDAKPVGKLLAFPDFLTSNRNWITTNEVSFGQAAGLEPPARRKVSFWAKQDKVVIAVHHSGPISVRINTASKTLSQR
jgi:hypothetical protein